MPETGSHTSDRDDPASVWQRQRPCRTSTAPIRSNQPGAAVLLPSGGEPTAERRRQSPSVGTSGAFVSGTANQPRNGGVNPLPHPQPLRPTAPRTAPPDPGIRPAPCPFAGWMSGRGCPAAGLSSQPSPRWGGVSTVSPPAGYLAGWMLVGSAGLLSPGDTRLRSTTCLPPSRYSLSGISRLIRNTPRPLAE